MDIDWLFVMVFLPSTPSYSFSDSLYLSFSTKIFSTPCCYGLIMKDDTKNIHRKTIDMQQHEYNNITSTHFVAERKHQPIVWYWVNGANNNEIKNEEGKHEGCNWDWICSISVYIAKHFDGCSGSVFFFLFCLTFVRCSDSILNTCVCASNFIQIAFSRLNPIKFN